MCVKLLTNHHLRFLHLEDDAQARLSLHLSNYHFVGKNMSRLIYEIKSAKHVYFTFNFNTILCTL